MRLIKAVIKKELLLFIRNPQELLIILAMPLILITILGFALGSVLDGDGVPVTGTVALIIDSNEELALTNFEEKLVELGLPDEARESIIAQARNFLPITMLKNDVFGQDELKQIFTLEELPQSQVEAVKKAGEYSAIIEVPEQFTSLVLTSFFIEETTIPPLTVYLNEGKELSASIVEDVLTVFQEQYSTLSALGREGLLSSDGTMVPIDVSGSIETLSQKEPISAFSYYAVGMSVMFILFITSMISSRTYLEKKSHMFDRIILANVPKSAYVLSIFVSTVIISFLQMVILYGGSALLYGLRWPHFDAFLFVTLALCCAVAGITVLLMAINYRLGTDSASQLFMSAFVAVLAFLGGSYIPVGDISASLAQVGLYTPNGAAMSAYLDILQGAVVADISNQLVVLLSLAVLLSAIAWLVFPRRVGTM